MVRPLFFRPCDWEVAQLVSIYATTSPRHLYHSAVSKTGDFILEHWIGKNPNESGFPNIIANEFICAQLAAEVGLLVPECQVQHVGDRVWFLSNYISSEPFTYRKLLRCRNIRDIPLLLLFDLWVCNSDRWGANMLLTRQSDAPDEYEFIVIDHSHALLGESDAPRVSLEIDPRVCFDFTELAEQITNDHDWDSALSELHGLSEAAITEAVEALSSMSYQSLDITSLVEQLVKRKERLTEYLHYAKTLRCFPNWA